MSPSRAKARCLKRVNLITSLRVERNRPIYRSSPPAGEIVGAVLTVCNDKRTSALLSFEGMPQHQRQSGDCNREMQRRAPNPDRIVVCQTGVGRVHRHLSLTQERCQRFLARKTAVYRNSTQRFAPRIIQRAQKRTDALAQSSISLYPTPCTVIKCFGAFAESPSFFRN